LKIFVKINYFISSNVVFNSLRHKTNESPAIDVAKTNPVPTEPHNKVIALLIFGFFLHLFYLRLIFHHQYS